MECGLCTLSDRNAIFKYADDSNLFVPEHTNVMLADIFPNTLEWACCNKMMINYSQSEEIVFHRPHPSKFSISFITSKILLRSLMLNSSASYTK